MSSSPPGAESQLGEAWAELWVEIPLGGRECSFYSATTLRAVTGVGRVCGRRLALQAAGWPGKQYRVIPGSRLAERTRNGALLIPGTHWLGCALCRELRKLPGVGLWGAW